MKLLYVKCISKFSYIHHVHLTMSTETVISLIWNYRKCTWNRSEIPTFDRGWYWGDNPWTEGWIKKTNVTLRIYRPYWIYNLPSFSTVRTVVKSFFSFKKCDGRMYRRTLEAKTIYWRWLMETILMYRYRIVVDTVSIPILKYRYNSCTCV